MNPAFSVIFLTTLIGAGQGLFLALYGAELAGRAGWLPGDSGFLVLGGAVALMLTALGLLASFFHLGRPERAWRSAAMWRTSWLSREVIALPAFMGLLLLWTWGHWQARGWTVGMGGLAVAACVALFICTAMVYASMRFLQEWASPFTLLNFTLLGLASGFTLAAALAAWRAPALVAIYGQGALVFTLAGLVGRCLSLWRNARLKPRSSVQSAIGIRHPQVVQRSMGFMGGSFNTREFFHGRSAGALRQVKWLFLVAAFVLPVALVLVALGQARGGFSAELGTAALPWLTLAVLVQYLGLLAERWFFLAQANHPQNLYYQAVS